VLYSLFQKSEVSFGWSDIGHNKPGCNVELDSVWLVGVVGNPGKDEYDPEYCGYPGYDPKPRDWVEAAYDAADAADVAP
jgi:hypothetical protein